MISTTRNQRRPGATRAQWYAVCAAVVAGALGTATSAQAADAIRGGLMYDKWWKVNGAGTPSGEHPMYPVDVSDRRGDQTFRCKECHGWDYKGVDGAYGKGSHFTGIPGVLGSPITAQQMTDIIKNPPATTTNGHDLASCGLSDEDIEDLVEFLRTALIDSDAYIDGDKNFIGDAGDGAVWYSNIETGACRNCHGSDGTQLNFGDEDEPEWVGTIAVDNPWEFLHKVRFGNPDSIMPSWTGLGGSDQGAANIGAYVQEAGLPVEKAPDAVVHGTLEVTGGSAVLKKGKWTVKLDATYSGFDGIDASTLKVSVDGSDPFSGATVSNGKRITLKSGKNKATLTPSQSSIKLSLKKYPGDQIDPSDGIELSVAMDGRTGSVVVPVTIEDVSLNGASGDVESTP
jgi:hypothetical protein